MSRGRLTQLMTFHALGSPGYLIAFDYDMELVEELKAAIPHTARAWMPENKEWFVKQEYVVVLRRLFVNADEFLMQAKML